MATRTVNTEAFFIGSVTFPIGALIDGSEVVADEFLEEATYDVRRHGMLRLFNILTERVIGRLQRILHRSVILLQKNERN